jgi:thymidine phosphorylase
MVDILARKRDGAKLTREEIEGFIRGYVAGEIPDYQASALLMAAFIRGLDDEETTWLTDAMARSGDMIDLSELGTVADKHSTGGVERREATDGLRKREQPVIGGAKLDEAGEITDRLR